jgi:hypothetical protein
MKKKIKDNDDDIDGGMMMVMREDGTIMGKK